MRNKKIPVFIIGVAILLITVVAHPAVNTKAVEALQPIIALLLFEEEVSIQSISESHLIKNGTLGLGKSFSYSFIDYSTNTAISGLSCEVISEPEHGSANLSFHGGEIVVNPTSAGNYLIRCHADNKLDYRDISFSIKAPLPFDTAFLEGYVEGQPLDQMSGIISNQYWINSSSKSNSYIREVIESSSHLKIVGEARFKGVLVELNTEDSSSIEQLEMLKLKEGIDWVRQRYFQGSGVFNDLLSIQTPQEYYDLAANRKWHLDYIEIDEAWDKLDVKNKTKIGITELVYDFPHSDLNIHGLDRSDYDHLDRSFKLSDGTEFFESDEKYIGAMSHGNATLSSIAATANDGGMVGVNWLSDICISNNNIGSIENLISSSTCGDIRVFNMSWLTTEKKLSNTFDQFDTQDLTAQFKLRKVTQPQYRDLANKNENKSILFVYGAGNGVGNGDPLNPLLTGYGVDARLENGGLHYDGNIPDSVDNIMVVGAINQQGILERYSDYGVSVDIAAPTEYFTAAANDYRQTSFSPKAYWTYDGTSAAAPVVTGVASLIFALKPDFKATEVKNILIKSAEKFVTRRQSINPQTGDEEPAELGNHIPILNAGNALKMAQEIVDGEKITADITLQDALRKEVTVTFFDDSDDFEVESIQLTLKIKDSNGEYVAEGDVINVSSSSYKLALPMGFGEFEISGTGTVLHKPTDIVKSTELLPQTFEVATVGLSTTDIAESLPVASVEVKIEPRVAFQNDVKHQVTTDNSGGQIVYLMPNSYKLHATISGYDNSSTELNILPSQVNQSYSKNISLTPAGAPIVGILSGLITDEVGQPISGATIEVIGGGVTTTATSDNVGQYQVTNIPKIVSGNYISEFVLTVSASGYVSSSLEDVVILKSSDGESSQNIPMIKRIAERDDDLEIVGDYNNQRLWLDNELIINPITYRNAEKYCESLDINGLTQWRLPTIQELESLVDKSQFPTVALPFKNFRSRKYFSTTYHSTTRRCPTINGYRNYGVDFSNGKTIPITVFSWQAFCSVGSSNRENFTCIHEQ